jgi:hypothetical protein
MKKIIGVSTLALLLGTPAVFAQTGDRDGAVPPPNGRAGPVVVYGPGSNVITPRNDPDSTNSSKATEKGPYHKELNSGGEPTGPVDVPANGG